MKLPLSISAVSPISTAILKKQPWAPGRVKRLNVSEAEFPLENSEPILTAKQRVERLAAGGGFCLAGFSLAAILIGRQASAWTAFFLYPFFAAGILNFLQVRGCLCAFRGLLSPSLRNKVLMLWLQALTGALLLTGGVLFILLKVPFINKI